jgi:predicted signal transduction protein with EAL and GGDEF domain
LLSLTRLGVDIVKLDKSVADLLAVEGAAGGVMRQLAAAIRAAAFQVIAEGVETPAQAELLRAAGVTLAQGWLFSKPLRPQQFLEYYHTRPGHEDDEPILLTASPDSQASDEAAVPLDHPDDSGVVELNLEPAPLTAIAGKPSR